MSLTVAVTSPADQLATVYTTLCQRRRICTRLKTNLTTILFSHLLVNNGTTTPMTKRGTCQTFVLTPAMKVAVHRSAGQPPTKLMKYQQMHSSRSQLPTCFHRFCDHHRGSFTRVQRIQQSYYSLNATLMVITKVIDTCW